MKSLLLTLSLITVSPFSWAEEIVLKDVKPAIGPGTGSDIDTLWQQQRLELEKSKPIVDYYKRVRDRNAQKQAAHAEAMQTMGYIVVGDERVKSVDRNRTLTPLAQVIDKLNYTPMNIVGTPFEGCLLGVVAIPDSSGIHSLVYLFDIPELGKVQVTEFSYATSEKLSSLRIQRPLGNITINGVEGSLYVFKNQRGDLGMSEVHVATNGKLYSLRVMIAAEVGSQERALFEELAMNLY